MQKNKLYFIILIACLAGYGWLYFYAQQANQIANDNFSVCIFKSITSIPCPSCGTTRAILSLVNGNVIGSIIQNPFAIIVSFIMLICPPWIVFDLISKKESFYQFYKKTEVFLRKKKVYIPLLILVVCNWIWNLNKNI